MELTPEQKTAIDEANKYVPSGFEIVSTQQVNELMEQRANLLLIFSKFKPVIAAFGGKPGGDLMSMLPQIMPVVQGMQGDAQLAEAFEKALSYT